VIPAPVGPQAQRAVIRDFMAHEGLPDKRFARVLMPLGDHDVFGYPEILQERFQIPGGPGPAVTWQLLTVSGYPPMSTENVPSPRDNTLHGPAARVPSWYLVRAWPSTNTQPLAWTSSLMQWVLPSKPTGHGPVRKPSTVCGAAQRRKNTNAWITERESHQNAGTTANVRLIYSLKQVDPGTHTHMPSGETRPAHEPYPRELSWGGPVPRGPPSWNRGLRWPLPRIK